MLFRGTAIRNTTEISKCHSATFGDDFQCQEKARIRKLLQDQRNRTSDWARKFKYLDPDEGEMLRKTEVQTRENPQELKARNEGMPLKRTQLLATVVYKHARVLKASLMAML